MASTKRMKLTTKAVTEKGIYTWTIENYHVIKTEIGGCILSPEFSVGCDNKKYFKLQFYPQGSKEAAGYLSIYLYYLRTDEKKKPDKLICRSKISVIKDKKVVQIVQAHLNCATGPARWGWSKFYNLKNIDKLISSKNTITFECVLEVFKKLESSIDSKITENVDETIDGIKLDSAFLNEEFSDVKLITSDKNSIPAHKIILATASPVFKAMLTHDMLERKSNSVEIPDIPYDILVEMLRYIYTGDVVSTKTDIVLKILAAADKYQIDNLKVKCEKILRAELTTENVLEILEAAIKYNVQYLRGEAAVFVADHKKSIFDSEELSDIAETVMLNIIEARKKSRKRKINHDVND